MYNNKSTFQVQYRENIEQCTFKQLLDQTSNVVFLSHYRNIVSFIA